ncbi:hypothetical protein ILYODFUR_033802 [Ilyodon furcidens]|uniref:Uncharacterized protein n=1 Tax=Ilyodon furcidens TaxID=33524 RepID=A0ABV0TDA8_9TELE
MSSRKEEEEEEEKGGGRCFCFMQTGKASPVATRSPVISCLVPESGATHSLSRFFLSSSPSPPLSCHHLDLRDDGVISCFRFHSGKPQEAERESLHKVMGDKSDSGLRQRRTKMLPQETGNTS